MVDNDTYRVPLTLIVGEEKMKKRGLLFLFLLLVTPFLAYIHVPIIQADVGDWVLLNLTITPTSILQGEFFNITLEVNITSAPQDNLWFGVTTVGVPVFYRGNMYVESESMNVSIEVTNITIRSPFTFYDWEGTVEIRNWYVYYWDENTQTRETLVSKTLSSPYDSFIVEENDDVNYQVETLRDMSVWWVQNTRTHRGNNATKYNLTDGMLFAASIYWADYRFYENGAWWDGTDFVFFEINGYGVEHYIREYQRTEDTQYLTLAKSIANCSVNYLTQSGIDRGFTPGRVYMDGEQTNRTPLYDIAVQGEGFAELAYVLKDIGDSQWTYYRDRAEDVFALLYLSQVNGAIRWYYNVTSHTFTDFYYDGIILKPVNMMMYYLYEATGNSTFSTFCENVTEYYYANVYDGGATPKSRPHYANYFLKGMIYCFSEG